MNVCTTHRNTPDLRVLFIATSVVEDVDGDHEIKYAVQNEAFRPNKLIIDDDYSSNQIVSISLRDA